MRRSKMRADVICSMRWEQRRNPKDIDVTTERDVSAARVRPWLAPAGLVMGP
jgi:hypothetical protein